MATSPPNPPEKTIIERDSVHTQTRLVPDPDAANKSAWIAGLSVLALVLFVGFFWMMTKPTEVKSERTSVTVTSPERDPAPNTTTVIATDTASTQPEDINVFVTNTERTISRLSRSDDAANQAEIEAIRRRMNDLRSADQAQAQAIQAELQDSIARLESQNEALAASTGSTTSSVTTTTTTAPITTASASAPDPKMVDELSKRLDAVSVELTQVSQNANPQVTEQLPELNKELTELKEHMEEALRAPAQEQTALLSDLQTDLVALETSLQSLSAQ